MPLSVSVAYQNGVLARYTTGSNSLTVSPAIGAGLPSGATLSSVRTLPGNENVVFVTVSSFGVGHLWKSTNNVRATKKQHSCEILTCFDMLPNL